jgi:hypothetical protein
MQGVKAEPSTSKEPTDGFDYEAQKEIDARSIYVGNVEYKVESAELAEFFGVRSASPPCHRKSQDRSLHVIPGCRFSSRVSLAHDRARASVHSKNVLKD